MSEKKKTYNEWTDILKRKITLYQGYEDFLTGDDPDTPVKNTAKSNKLARRKRDVQGAQSTRGRKSGHVGDDAVLDELARESGAPETLKDKVQLNY